ncbi:hypothetical protein JCM9279_004714 [Rhodotorula babjevae]
MDPFVPLADDPLPPPSPSYTHSSASSTSRSHLRPADLHSLSSRESDWSSSSDAEHVSEEDADDDDDEAFDLVSSAELPPPVATAPAPPPGTASIRSIGTGTSSGDSASESAVSADESDSASHMKLSFPDPLNASSSSAASDAPAEPEREQDDEPVQHMDLGDSILLDGEGAYSLLLDARPAPSSAASSGAELDAGSGLTSPLLRAQDDPRSVGDGSEDEQHARAVEGGVGEWVRRTRLSAKKREQGMRERGVQTVRSVEVDGDDAAKLELGSSVLSSMVGSSLVSSQATVVPSTPIAVVAPEVAEAAEQHQVASQPLSPDVEVAAAASAQRPARLDSPLVLVQRRRTLLAVALATTLALSASIWLGPTPVGRGSDVATRACERDVAGAGAQAVGPVVELAQPSTADLITSSGWLEAILPASSAIATSSMSADAVVAVSGAPSPLSPRRGAPPAAVDTYPSSPTERRSTAPASLADPCSSTRPCAACAVATVPVAQARGVIPFAPALHAPTATAVAHGKRCGHARPRRARVELGHGAADGLHAGAAKEQERVSLFRKSAAEADLPVEATEAASAALARTLQDRVHDLVAQHLARAQRVLAPAPRANVVDGAGRLARTTGTLILQSTQASVDSLVERARRMRRRVHVRKTLQALGSSPGTRTRREVDRLLRFARRAPESAHGAVAGVLSPSRRVRRATEAGRRAVFEAALAAQLPHRARRALRRIEASVPSRRQLKQAAASRMPELDLRADLHLVVARIRSYASASLAQASSVRVAVGVGSERCKDAVQGGAEDSARHVRRAARTARRLTKKAEQRLGRRARRA